MIKFKRNIHYNWRRRKMYKLIAIDLDETLLNSEKTVSKKNIEAILKAEEMGVRIAIATGRGVAFVQDTLKAIGFHDQENEYVISFNGGAVTENKGNRFLYTDPLPFDFVSELYKKGIEYDVSVQVFTREDIFVYHYPEEERAYLEPGIKMTEIYSKNIDFLKDTEIIKVMFMNTDHNYLRQIAEDLKGLTVEREVTYSSNRYIEFTDQGVSKGTALKFLADHLDIELSETIVVGDNFNDHSMFKVAGFAVGVKNMVPELKDEVDYITEAHHDDDAVAEVINKFILEPQKENK